MVNYGDLEEWLDWISRGSGDSFPYYESRETVEKYIKLEFPVPGVTEDNHAD